MSLGRPLPHPCTQFLDADLHLDRVDAVGHDLGGFARGGVGIHQAYAVRDLDAVAYFAAKQLVDWDAVDLADSSLVGAGG